MIIILIEKIDLFDQFIFFNYSKKKAVKQE
jgi:hypothetical protein